MPITLADRTFRLGFGCHRPDGHATVPRRHFDHAIAQVGRLAAHLRALTKEEKVSRTKLVDVETQAARPHPDTSRQVADRCHGAGAKTFTVAARWR